MVGIAADHGLERGDDFLRAGFRRAIWMPQAPGMEVHARLREKRGGVEVVGILLDHFAHRVMVGLGRFAAVRIG